MSGGTGVMPQRRCLEKIEQPLPGEPHLIGSLRQRCRMPAGKQNGINFLWLRGNQFQIPVDKGAGVEKLDRGG